MLLKLKPKYTQEKTATLLGISRSTLNAEIARGAVEQLDTNLKLHKVYFTEVGQRVYEEHRCNSVNPFKLAKAAEFLGYAEREILIEKHSPDVVCGIAKKRNLFNGNIVCAKTLYNYIDLCLLKVRNIDLPLRVKLKTKTVRDRKNKRIFGESIENHPEKINNRTEFGHWEIDTVFGTKDASLVLLTLDKRITRQRIIMKIESRSSEAVNNAMKKILHKYGKKRQMLFKSITSDNGIEFAKLQETVKDIPVYFAHPYSSYEHGTNECANKLVRRFIPNGCDIADFTKAQVKCIRNWINNYPRKIFGGLSSVDLMNILNLSL